MQCQVLSVQRQLLLQLCRQAAAVWKGQEAWESWRERGAGGRALLTSRRVAGETEALRAVSLRGFCTVVHVWAREHTFGRVEKLVPGRGCGVDMSPVTCADAIPYGG